MSHYSSFTSASNNGAPDVELTLYEDHWKIKKVLTTSDVDKSCLLLLSSNAVEEHVLSSMGENDAQECRTGEGKEFEVWDADTSSSHTLFLKKWANTNYFVLTGGWKKEFVKRRDLKKDDMIELFWNGAQFFFKLLNKN